MSVIQGTALIECEQCKNNIVIDASDMEMVVIGQSERQMGPETSWTSNLELICPRCNQEIEINYEMWEYPVGAINYEEHDVTKGRVVEWFSVDFYSEDSELLYNFEEVTNLVIAKNELYIPQLPEIVKLSSSISELIEYLKKYPQNIYSIDSRKFEEIINEIFRNNGFQTELTKKTRDGGRDIIALKSDMGIETKYLIECKRYAKNKLIGVELVRTLYGVHMQEGANKSILVTTSSFSEDAQRFAQNESNTRWHLQLKDYNDVVGWISQYRN